jgi:hypothetical protein
MNKLPDALEILADSDCRLGLKVIGNRQSKNPLEFKVARYHSKYLVGPAHEDQLVSCCYPDPNIRHLEMRHHFFNCLFKEDGQLELTLLNTEQEVTVPDRPAFIFYNKIENMPGDVEYFTVDRKDFLNRCHEKQRDRRKKMKN